MTAAKFSAVRATPLAKSTSTYVSPAAFAACRKRDWLARSATSACMRSVMS